MVIGHQLLLSLAVLVREDRQIGRGAGRLGDMVSTGSWAFVGRAAHDQMFPFQESRLSPNLSILFCCLRYHRFLVVAVGYMTEARREEGLLVVVAVVDAEGLGK